MKKIADIIDTDIDSLIQKLLGAVPIDAGNQDSSIEYYQLPVKHTKAGVEIDEVNKPWVISTYIPGKRIGPRHPHGHNGVDLGAAHGAPIYPIASGKVSKVRTLPKGGLTVNITHEDGRVVSYYAHLSAINVSVGDEVTQTTVIGKMGDTGNAKGTSPHLHYEVRIDGNHINPQSLTGKKVGTLSKKADFISGLIKKLNSLAEDDDFSDIIKNNNL